MDSVDPVAINPKKVVVVAVADPDPAAASAASRLPLIESARILNCSDFRIFLTQRLA